MSSKLVNVGCGNRIHPSWLNLDLHAAVPGVVACDLTKGLPVKDGEADVVYSAAVLEHVRAEDTPAFLRECHRALAPGGHLRIAVPDFEAQAREYLASVERLDAGQPHAEADRAWMMLEIYDQSTREHSGGRMAEFLADPKLPNEPFIVGRIGKEGGDLIAGLKGKPMSSRPRRRPYIPWGKLGEFLLARLLRSRDLDEDLRALEIGRFRLASGELHQNAYDRFSLARLLQANGFRDIKACGHGDSEIPGWKSFYLEIDEEGQTEKPDLLIMEAKK